MAGEDRVEIGLEDVQEACSALGLGDRGEEMFEHFKAHAGGKQAEAGESKDHPTKTKG